MRSSRAAHGCAMTRDPDYKRRRRLFLSPPSLGEGSELGSLRQLGERSGKIVAGQAQLFARALGAVDHGAEREILFAILRVPAQMLARDAHALRLAVKRIQIFQMLDEDGAD